MQGQNYETPSKNKFKAQINNKLRWLTSDINFQLLLTECPIAHVQMICEVHLNKGYINSFFFLFFSIFI